MTDNERYLLKMVRGKWLSHFSELPPIGILCMWIRKYPLLLDEAIQITIDRHTKTPLDSPSCYCSGVLRNLGSNPQIVEAATLLQEEEALAKGGSSD
jgi:hypothetical protein